MGSKGKVVIADDNKDICGLLTEMLKDEGYDVDSVYNGYELLSYLEDNNPAVIVLDLMMPEKTGLSILGTIKQVSPYSRIIIYTGYQEYETSVYARTADRFLVKGSDLGNLLEAVSELV